MKLERKNKIEKNNVVMYYGEGTNVNNYDIWHPNGGASGRFNSSYQIRLSDFAPNDLPKEFCTFDSGWKKWGNKISGMFAFAGYAVTKFFSSPKSWFKSWFYR